MDIGSIKNTVIQGDCLEILTTIPDNSIDAIVTDPPYELWFMGKSWDSTGIAYNKDMRNECLRVLKPWWHLLAFSGTRTYHRMAVAIEDAGFEVRDMIEWVYGSGFPKSLNIGKSIENKLLTGNASKNGFHKLEGERREGRIGMYDTVEEQGFRKVNPDQLGAFDLEPTTDEAKQWNGWGTALKPAHEPICMARKPLAEKTVAQNVLKYGTGGINIDESRVDVADSEKVKQEGHIRKGNVVGDNRTSVAAGQFGDGAFVAGTDLTNGRFPANLIHDSSEEVRECFPETKSGSKPGQKGKNMAGFGDLRDEQRTIENAYGDSGNASRFFKSIIYQAKASKSERNKGCEEFEDKERVDYGGFHSEKGLIENNRNPENRLPTKNNHPTVKPIALMEYLIKMVTPKGGIVLDPFTGSGSTLVAAKQNGFQYIGIEMTEEYITIIEARLNAVVKEEPEQDLQPSLF